jgi:hypothetical protein
MGAAGSPHATFQRALKQGNLTMALAVARELPLVRLGDALALTLLILERDPPRYSTAAARWAARFVLEATPVPTLAESQLLASALAELPSPPAREALARICAERALHECTAAIDRWSVDSLRG